MFKETFTSCPTCTPPLPVVSSRVPTLPAFFSHDNQSTFTSASLFQAVPSSAPTLPVTFLRVTDRLPMFTSSSAFPVGTSHAFAGPSSRVPGSPGLARTTSCDPAHLYTPGPVYTHATQALGSVGSTSHGTVFCHASTGAQTPSPLIEDPRHVLPSLHPTSECFLATITATMEKMSANHDLPPLQVFKFNGSPERYPLFRQRFHQMVESKSLDEQTKMARLLQFLKGPALRAVHRYEAVSGGLAKSLEVLQNRFGQPFKIVRACIDTLTKGPAIAPQDKEGLQRYADLAQVMYDTLESMGCLGEMNTDSLEKVVLRLPKWLQDKFREHLKKLERQGKIMPTFKDVVEFLNDRADFANHPFFTSTSTEVKSLRRNEDRNKPNLRHLTTLTTSSIKEDSRFARVKDIKPSNCLLCTEFHPLYRCEMFKSKPIEERRELVFKNRICFNCINSTEHLAKSCKSPVRCKVTGCGKSHHTLLHQPSPTRGNADHQTSNTEITDIPAVTTPLPSIQDATSSTCAAATVAESSEISCIIPLRIIGDNGRHITTYGLIDSGSDVTMIDPSLVQQLGIQGEEGQLLLSTVSQRDRQEKGVKVDFKIAPVDDSHTEHVTVHNAWAVRDLTIPLKHVTAHKKLEQLSHLRHVPFSEVERKFLIGTSLQEAFISLFFVNIHVIRLFVSLLKLNVFC